jgi:hypothetical protein
MARFAVQHRARSVKALEAFDADGYAGDKAASSPAAAGFRRGTTACQHRPDRTPGAEAICPGSGTGRASGQNRCHDMRHKTITPELRRWIVDQAEAGCRPRT